MEECAICKGNASYITIAGGWYLCKECIETGKSEGMGE